MLNEIYDNTKQSMDKSIESLKHNYKSLRTGKVLTSILDGITIDYYGTQTGLSQVANVIASNSTN